MIRVREATMTCWACPSQWEGETDDGRWLYVRYRYGWLTVTLSDPGGTLDDAVAGSVVVLDKQVGGDFDGVMNTEQLAEHTRGLMEWPGGF